MGEKGKMGAVQGSPTSRVGLMAKGTRGGRKDASHKRRRAVGNSPLSNVRKKGALPKRATEQDSELKKNERGLMERDHAKS